MNVSQSLLTLALVIYGAVPAYAAPSLCKTNEHIIFSCRIKKSTKQVSLCASKKLTEDIGYLQYRFGTLKKIEMEFPAERKGSQAKFSYSHYFRPSLDRFHISFKNAGYAYNIYSEYDDEQARNYNQTGIMVNSRDKQTIDLVCVEPIKADFSEISNVLRCDDESQCAR